MSFLAALWSTARRRAPSIINPGVRAAVLIGDIGLMMRNGSSTASSIFLVLRCAEQAQVNGGVPTPRTSRYIETDYRCHREI